jgi:hypothetical protein
MVQERAFVGDAVPVLDCVIDVVPVLTSLAHNLRTLIPYTLAVVAPIEEMFFGFFLLIA